MTHGKPKRCRAWTFTPGELATDKRARLLTVRADKERWITYRDNCAHLAEYAGRHIDKLTEEELVLMAALEAQGVTA